MPVIVAKQFTLELCPPSSPKDDPPESRALELEALIRATIQEEASKYATEPKMAKSTNTRNYVCSVVGCERVGVARGLCNAHYLRLMSGKSLDGPIKGRLSSSTCIDCGKPRNCKGAWDRCQHHYRIRRRFLVKKAMVAAFGGKCSKCRNSYPIAVYDFHHLGDKEEGISFLFDNASSKRISEELTKCELMCANCHRIEHSRHENADQALEVA